MRHLVTSESSVSVGHNLQTRQRQVNKKVSFVASLPAETSDSDLDARVEAVRLAIEAGADPAGSLLKAGYPPEAVLGTLESPAFKAAVDRALRRHVELSAFMALKALRDVARDGKPIEKVAAAKAIRDWAGLGAARGPAGGVKDLNELDAAGLASVVQRAQHLLSMRAKPVIDAASVPVARQTDEKMNDLLG